MDTNLYYYFYMLCECKGFSAAGEKMFVTQPAVSYAINKLEEQLGVSLYVKNSKTFILTTEGKELYSKIKKEFDNLIQVGNYMKRLAKLEVGEIKIGAPEHIAKILLIEKIKKFNRFFPEVKFQLVTGNSNYLINELLNGDIDLLIDCDPLDFDKLEGFSSEVWANERFVFFCDANNERQSINIEEFDKAVFALPSRTTNCTKELFNRCDKYDKYLNVQFFMSTSDLVKSMVEGDIVGYAMEGDIKRSKKYKILSTDLEMPKYNIYKIWGSHIGKVVKQFLDVL